MKIPELMSPAGNYTNFLAAIENGADSIYMGVEKFNARVMTGNFKIEEYKEAILYAHLRNVKIYLTLNTLLFDDEIKEALSTLSELVSAGLDAVIVQDMGLASLIHEIFPNLELHASTQMTIHNTDSARMLESLGFSRVVLARELSLFEIKEIKENTKLEIETFIHGAACVAYSGACQMSNLVGGRSGNRGNCAQPCRLSYTLESDAEKIENLYLLSNKDIYGLPYLKQLVEIGVSALKIEGRNKSPEYVAVTTRIYRKYLDALAESRNFSIDPMDEQKLLQVFNRSGFHSHYFDKKCGKDSISFHCPKNTGIKLGTIVDQYKEFIKVKLDAPIDLHDGIEVLGTELSGIVTCIKNEDRKITNQRIEAGNIAWLGDFSSKVKPDSVLYKTSSSALKKEVEESYSGKTFFRKNEIYGKIQIKKGCKVQFEVWDQKHHVALESDAIVDEAQKTAITKEDVFEKLNRTTDSPFEFKQIAIELDPGSFVPISEFNALRRKALENLTTCYLPQIDISNERKQIDSLKPPEYQEALLPENIVDLFLYHYDGQVDDRFKNIGRIFLDYQLVLKDETILDTLREEADVYISLPPTLKGALEQLIKSKLKKWASLCSGFLISNIGYLYYFNTLNLEQMPILVGDFNLNITNQYAYNAYKKMGFSELTLSIELSEQNILNFNALDANVIVSGNIPSMISEYCPVGSFLGGFSKDSDCKKPCLKGRYFLTCESDHTRMELLTDPINCSVRIMRKMNREHLIPVLKQKRIRKVLD